MTLMTHLHSEIKEGHDHQGSNCVDVSSDEWYHRNQCPGSPKTPWRVLRLAYTIWEEDFSQVIEQEELESHVIYTLTYCFHHFDPTKGRPDSTIEDRFMRFFRFMFRRRLKDIARDSKNQDRQKATARYLQCKASLCPISRKAAVYENWSWLIYAQALKRLSSEAQKFVRLHHVQGMTLDEMPPLMKLSRSTLIRKYKFDRLVQIIKNEVKAMILSIPREKIDQLVYTLYFENHFDEEEIARLLCVPVSFVVEVVQGVTGKVMRGLERDAGRTLFEGL